MIHRILQESGMEMVADEQSVQVKGKKEPLEESWGRKLKSLAISIQEAL